MVHLTENVAIGTVIINVMEKYMWMLYNMVSLPGLHTNLFSVTKALNRVSKFHQKVRQ